MNYVDIVIILFLLSSAIQGVFQGAALQVFSFGGFWGGLALGAVIAPFVSGFFDGTTGKAVASLVTVFGLALLLGAVGRRFGAKAWGRLRTSKLGKVDSVVGAAVAGIATLFALWLIAIMLSTVAIAGISKGIQESKIIREVTQRMPPAPSVFARMRQIFSAAGFPQVFAELEPLPSEEVELPSDPEVRAALEAAGPSTVRVVGAGCGGIQTGSGFVVEGGLVVTNAHVIAGIEDPVVEDSAGRHRATPVLFDPDLDLAVLRASGLAGGPLTLLPGTVGRGGGTAVLGYPEGGPLNAKPSAIVDEFTATGRDIYGRDIVARRVYQLQAEVRSGNSGGPFVEADGDVLGVVFSRSAHRGDIGYSLVSPGDVIDSVEAARSTEGQVGTGPCA